MSFTDPKKRLAAVSRLLRDAWAHMDPGDLTPQQWEQFAEIRVRIEKKINAPKPPRRKKKR